MASSDATETWRRELLCQAAIPERREHGLSAVIELMFETSEWRLCGQTDGRVVRRHERRDFIVSRVAQMPHAVSSFESIKEDYQCIRRTRSNELVFAIAGENRYSLWQLWKGAQHNRRNVFQRMTQAEQSGQRAAVVVGRQDGADDQQSGTGRHDTRHLSKEPGELTGNGQPQLTRNAGATGKCSPVSTNTSSMRPVFATMHCSG